MNLPKLMIFDMDGLIFDTERLFMRMLTNAAKKHGYAITENMYLSTIGMCGENLKNQMISYFGKDYPFTDISHEARAELNDYAAKNGLPIKPGILNLLKFLKEKNIPCCICSSTHSPYVKNYVKLSEIDSYFEFIIGGEMVSLSKPNPDIFLKACEYKNVSPSECIVLEDSENGILAASSAGIPVICIPDLKQPSELINNKTVCTIPNADCLIDMFN